MSDAVKPKRRYDASGRQEQARRTRLAVLDAARRRFLADGYAAATVAGIAADAGVSVETVYKAFANKPGLVKALFDVALVGDDEPVPLIERDHVRRMRAEADPRVVFRLYGEHLAASAPRTVPVQLLAKAAAATDEGAAAVWAQLVEERLTGMTMFAGDLRAKGFLRPGLSVEDARDVLWTCIAPELYDLLVTQRGWSPERYGAWVAEVLTATLLSPAVG